MKRLGESPKGRRDHLRAYLLGCIQDNIMTMADLITPGVIDKVLQTAAQDIRHVLTDLGKSGGRNALAMLGAQLMSFAEGIR